jgi:hypothetical protein
VTDPSDPFNRPRPPRRPVPVQTYPTAPVNQARMEAETQKGLRQDRLAREGKAEGQCQHCRAYTWDGEPPRWHVRGCPDGDR